MCAFEELEEEVVFVSCGSPMRGWVLLQHLPEISTAPGSAGPAPAGGGRAVRL